MKTLITILRERNWLTAGALWTIALSWAAAGVWGWSQTAIGIIAPVLMALTVAAQIAGARMVAIASQATLARRIALIALAIGCVCWSGYAGKRAIEASEAQRLAPAAAYADALARVQAADPIQIARWAGSRGIDVTECASKADAALVIAQALGYVA